MRIDVYCDRCKKLVMKGIIPDLPSLDGYKHYCLTCVPEEYKPEE